MTHSTQSPGSFAQGHTHCREGLVALPFARLRVNSPFAGSSKSRGFIGIPLAILLSGSLAFLLPRIAFAEEFSVQASVDRNQVAVNEPFRLTIQTTGAVTGVGDPQIPALDGFEIYAGGRSQNVSFVNGQVSSVVTFVYTLVPRKAGAQTIPSITFSRDGRVYGTNPITISVGQAKELAGKGGSGAGTATERPIFSTGDTSRHSPYVGEQIVYTFKFYRRVQLLSRPGYRPPDFSGFVVEDLQPKAYQATVGGAGYMVDELRYALFPVSPGSITIGSATLQVSVADLASDDPFQMFFGGGRTMTVGNDPVTVNVQPLPAEGRPAGFSGAVGSYRMTATCDKKSVAAGQPITLTVEVAGRGLVKSLREPAWPVLPSARRYETVTSLNVQNTGGAIEGSKTFKTIIVPSATGILRIPPIEYSYFDPAEKAYVVLKSQAISVTVKPGVAGSSAVPYAGNAGGLTGVKTLQSDIRFLKSAPGRAVSAGSPIGLIFWVMLLIPAGFMVMGAGVYRLRSKADRDPLAARVRSARAQAERRLVEAKKKAGADPVRFHGALHDVLVNFLADRWGVAASGLTIQETENRLRVRSAPPELLERTRSMWEEADRIRYAPQASANMEPAVLINEVKSILLLLERYI